MLFRNLWGAAALLTLFPSSSLASVLAVDFGAEWIKASILKPGIPFDVLLNKDSKRKIQSSVAWKKEDRLFSTDAANLGSRFPQDTFSSIKLLQAAPHDAEIVTYFHKISSANLFQTSRKTVGVKQSDGTEWSTEELIAMQLSYIKGLAEAHIGEKVHETIVAVPPYYSQFERDAVADAIEIADLRTLALINDGTAVAVNYAMTRTFDKPEYHIIYDAGASSIRATLVQFKSDPKTIPAGTVITVQSVGYDRTVGGIELDRRLREILIEDFIATHKKDVRKDKKGLAKLWKEASRVKAILSANSEARAQIESLAWDIDFKSKVTRAAFETACDDLKPRFAQPIRDALTRAGLSMSDISSVILTGGSTRTPMIQAAVKAAVGEDKIALNVNADEAAVLGAGLHGASVSRQFKTKNIRVVDISIHDVQAIYAVAAGSDHSRPRTITTVVFPSGSKVGTKKTLTFKRKEDFSIAVDLKTPPAPGFPTRLLETTLTGVSEALANLTERGAIDPVVKATITLSESGFVSVSEAVAFGHIKDESITGKLKGFFGAGSSSTSPSEETAENTPPRDPLDGESTSTSTSASPTPEPTKEVKGKDVTIPLTLKTEFTSIAPMTVEEKKTSRSRLRAIDQEESVKNRREEARNTLESYLYRLRDLLDEENKGTPFRECSQAQERKAIQEKVDDTMIWVQDLGDVAETSQLLDKRIAIEALERPIIHRYKEIEQFPSTLNNSQMWNWSTRLFLTEAKRNLTMELNEGLPSKWTSEELQGLEKTLIDHERWLNEWVEKQKSVKRNEDPVIETTEMKARSKVLETQLQKLVKRKIPKPIKKPTTTTESVAPKPTPTHVEEEEKEEPISGDGEDIDDDEGTTKSSRPDIHDEL